MNEHNEDVKMQSLNVTFGNSKQSLPFKFFDISNSPNLLLDDDEEGGGEVDHTHQTSPLEHLKCIPPFIDLNRLLEPIYITSKDLTETNSSSSCNSTHVNPLTSSTQSTAVTSSTHSGNVFTQPISSTHSGNVFTQPISSTHSNHPLTTSTSGNAFTQPIHSYNISTSSTHSNSTSTTSTHSNSTSTSSTHSNNASISSTHSSSTITSSTHSNITITSSTHSNITITSSTHSNLPPTQPYTIKPELPINDDSILSDPSSSSVVRQSKKRKFDETLFTSIINEITICEESDPETDEDIIIID